MTEPRNPLEVVEEALETITKAEGPYGRDRLTHAENTITHMVMQARAALALVRKLRADAVVGWVEGDGRPEWQFALGNDMERDGHVFLYQIGGEDMVPALLLPLPLLDSAIAALTHEGPSDDE